MNRSTTSPTAPATATSTTLASADLDIDPQWLDPVLATVGPGTAGRTAFSWDEDVSGDAAALAELFLGNPRRGTFGTGFADLPKADDHPLPKPTRDSLPNQQVEALVLGHLPILGTAWIGGYASLLAARLESPVALVKLRAGYLTIDLYSARCDHPSTPRSVDDAIAHARRTGARWLVCSDATDEPTLVRQASPSGVTVLTAADDPAVLSAYQAIKGLLEPQDGQPAWPDHAGLTIALAASTPEKSRLAGDKLRSAVRTFLGREVHVDICPQRITPASAFNLYAGPWEDSLIDLVAALKHDGRQVSAQAPPPIPAPTPASTASRAVARADDAALDATEPPTPIAPSLTTSPPRDVLRAAIRQVIHQDPPEPVCEPPDHPPSAPPHIDPLPAPAPSPTQAASSHADVPPSTSPGVQSQLLSTFIDGLRPIPVTCPYAPTIELALDATGSLHLVSSVPSLALLARASAWARDHAPLLRAAVPGFAPAPSTLSVTPQTNAAPACHVIDEDPALLRPLIESDLRVHLLIRGRTSGIPFAVARPLN